MFFSLATITIIISIIKIENKTYPYQLSMNASICSKASNASSKMLEELASRSNTRIYRSEGTFNDQEMRVIWNALGLYISRNLRMGRGINVPKLGIFTFTPPELRLKGVTNEVQRDLKPRLPVFLIQKDFIKGVPLKSAIFYHQEFGMGLRPYAALGATGQIPVTKMNLVEVASYSNMNKDEVELGINRIVRYIGEKLLAGQNLAIEIPNVGQMISRGYLVAVKFNEYLHRDTRNILSKSIPERKQKGNMSLTSDNLKKFAHLSEMNQKLTNKQPKFFEIDDNTRNYLNKTYGFHFDDFNLRRSTTNFDRTIATREFDSMNKSLKDSQKLRISQTGFLTGKIKAFSREYNMALKLVKEWVKDFCGDSETSFKDFVAICGRKTEAMNQNDVWNACKNISADITEQQAHQLFRIVDFNKDGFITNDDWLKIIKFNSNKLLKELNIIVQRQKYDMKKVLQKMGLDGAKKHVNVLTLKEGLKKLNPKLSDENAIMLSKYIGRGKNEIQIENIMEILQIGDSQAAAFSVDKEWQEKFLARLKARMNEKHILEEQLLNKLRFHDKNNSGYIEQSEFKNVLAQLGISLNLSELIKVVKVFPINNQNQIQYLAVLDKLYAIQPSHKEQLTQKEFIKIIKQKLIDRAPFPIRLPISVPKFTSEIQAIIFKDESEEELLPFVRKIDVNGNNQISQQDIKKYKETIREKRPQKRPAVEMEVLLTRIRERTVKKKISYYDFFKMIDKNNNGFLTKEEWMQHLDEIVQFTEEEKESLFSYLDKKGIQMVDYKTFLDVVNGNNSRVTSEKFDWAEQALGFIKDWFRTSALTPQDAYRLIDRDSDSYINQKDLSHFLIEKIKYEPRDLNRIRLNKLLKMLDSYKNGKVDLLDWLKFITGSTTSWVNSAKQQIGIVLSRQFDNLSNAYFSITHGDQRMLFSAFEKWVKENKVLSGFMANDDILKHIFSQFDAHKKGYLLENDFTGIFGSYNWKDQHTQELIDSLRVKFRSCDDAFKCMAAYSKGKQINFERFYQFLGEIFGNRFKRTDAKNIWERITNNQDILTQKGFKEYFGENWGMGGNPIDKEYPKDDWQYEDFTIIKGTQTRTKEHEYTQKELMEIQCTKLVNNLKDILAASPKSLEQVFREVDTENSCKLTNLQFKKAFRLLNIALTSKQIDLLLNYCHFKLESLIDWREFIKRLQLKEDKIAIAQRIAPKLQHLSDLLHYYMVSPKDAFRKCNNPKTGYMDFEEFHKMLKDLYSQASEPLPEYQVLKDIYDHIDVRKDNHLDFQEFTQIFRNCNPPNLLMGTTPATFNLISKNRMTKDKDQGKPTREKSIPLFKHSPLYEQCVNLIGRNRRYLQECVQKLNKNGESLVDFKTVEEVIKKFGEDNGVKMDSALVRNVISFSMTGEKVDYRMLFTNFKDRHQEIHQFPKKKVF